MAESTSIKMKFGTMSGEKTWTFKYADADVTNTNLRNLANVMIENGSIYKYPPLSLVSATIVTTNTRTVSL